MAENESSLVRHRSLRQIALDELASEVCVCGKLKKTEQPFCYGCYSRLPNHLRNQLYRTMSEGYAASYDEAKDWIRINQP